MGEVLSYGSFPDDADEFIGFADDTLIDDLHGKGAGLLEHAIGDSGFLDFAGGMKGRRIDDRIEWPVGHCVVTAFPCGHFIGVAFDTGLRADCLHAGGIVAEGEGGQLRSRWVRCLSAAFLRTGASAERKQAGGSECGTA